MDQMINSEKKKFNQMKFKENLSLMLMLMPYVLLFSIFIALPVAVAITLSLTSFNVIQTPNPIGLLNFINIFTQDEVFLKYVLPNTLMYAIIIGPGGYILAFILAWMIAQIQKGPRTIIALAIYSPSMVGGVFISVVWRTLFSGDESGYINALLMSWDMIDRPIQFLQSPEYLMNIVIIVALWSSMGVGFLAMLAGILNGNEELYEAAYIEGIRNKFQEVMYVTVPMMKPQMLFGAVMSIVGTFTNGYIGVALSGSNPTPQNAAQLITNHIDDFGFIRYEMGYAAALSVVLLIMIWVFSKVAYRLFAERD
ncbi:sugar ABC transporter permease [Acholeplasma vituli]|uniref:Sugar ABC transporter permease n=2 Tax=Paracholeplasma vituli TaxID=69473 RepID=A0ABT2PUT9_9MOLU|nr:sugar ABC transporter permease [Paracholeplasma vituli]MCU0104697.1 sugar ABC transporter permease [Paracholeplasma vituli]